MTMNNFEAIVEGAKAQGVIVKQFCTFCTNSAEGELYVDDGDDGSIKVPVCEDCGLKLQNMYGVDTLDDV
jgi:hypothetical protein